MRRIQCVLLALLLASCGSDKTAGIPSLHDANSKVSTVTVQSVLARMSMGKYREGELLVKFRPDIVRASATELHQKIGASLIRRFTMVSGLEHIKLPPTVSLRDAITWYMSDQNVEYAEPNYLKHAGAVPNDPLFGKQWALLNTGQFAGATPGADLKAADAWNINTGSTDVVIAVIDTGIDYNHPDLAGNIWTNPIDSTANGIDEDKNGKIDDIHGWNFVSNNNDPMDDNGHGTHVSGIAGATGNNSVGVSGLMWSVRLMPLKILGADGSGTISDEISAIQYAVAKGVRILNASFSGSDYSNAEFDAINAANNAGTLLITAAGNGSNGETGDNNDLIGAYPANYKLPNIISVAATDQNDRRAVFSNYGPGSVHVGAPGQDILSTYPASFAPSPYQYESGTSMSTPYVSALAGLLFSQYAFFTAPQVRGTILRYVDVLPDLQGATITGGRVNAYKAVSSLLEPSGLSLTAQPAGAVQLSWKDNAAGEDGYTVQRKVGAGPYSGLASLPGNASLFTDTSVVDGTSYSYRVNAFNSLPNPPGTAAIQAESAAVEASTLLPLNPPTDLSATSISSSGSTLTWTDNSGAEEGYKVERKDPAGGFLQIAVTGPNANTFTDSGLSPQTTYIYHVRAFNTAAGDSAYSNDAAITTLAPSKSGTGSSGGGGCSIGARQNAAATTADGMVMLIPLVVLLIMRRRQC